MYCTVVNNEIPLFHCSKYLIGLGRPQANSLGFALPLTLEFACVVWIFYQTRQHSFIARSKDCSKKGFCSNQGNDAQATGSIIIACAQTLLFIATFIGGGKERQMIFCTLAYKKRFFSSYVLLKKAWANQHHFINFVWQNLIGCF